MSVDTIGRFGYVSEVDSKKYRVKVLFPELGIVSGWLPVATSWSMDRKTEDMPDIDEHVYCIMHENTGIVLCSVYDDENEPLNGEQEQSIRTEKDGTTFKYDRENSILSIEVQGDIEIHATGKINVVADGNMTLQGSHIDLN